MTTQEDHAEEIANERSRLDQVLEMAIRVENDTGLSLYTIGAWLIYHQTKRDQKDWTKASLEDTELTPEDRESYNKYSISDDMDLGQCRDYGEDILNALVELGMRYDPEGFTSPIIDQEVV